MMFVCMQFTPLVWAYTDGLRVIGAELVFKPGLKARMARQWADVLWAGASTLTVLAGRDPDTDTHIFAIPTGRLPLAHTVAHTVAARRRMQRTGVVCAWLSLASLAGTAVVDAATRAVFAFASLRGVYESSDQAITSLEEGQFRMGVTQVSHLVDMPLDLAQWSGAAGSATHRMLRQSNILAQALLEDASGHSDYLGECRVAQIKSPPMDEVANGLWEQLPVFSDPRFGQLSYPSIPAPWAKPWIPRMPKQPMARLDRCVRHTADLMPRITWRRVEGWLHRTLDDLICIRDNGTECERRRPSVLVVGQSELHPWARGIIWDLRACPAACATPLDFHEPLEHTLNVTYFKQRLANYPNQELLSFIVEGMRPWADVELQTVLVPHLLSLANGFQSVVKEIKRMSSPELNWYSLHSDFPFWPIYSLGEGCVPRKLEDRWRRCEEGGGPRKPTFDASGLRALSLNEASRIHHFPHHYQADTRPEWLDYLRMRKLPATEEDHAFVAANRGTKWMRQRMPRLSHAARSLVVLQHAGYLMGEPVYVFGDDIKDYFNHFMLPRSNST